MEEEVDGQDERAGFCCSVSAPKYQFWFNLDLNLTLSWNKPLWSRKKCALHIVQPTQSGEEVKCQSLWELESDHCTVEKGGRGKRERGGSFCPPPPLPYSEPPIFPTSPSVVPKQNPISFHPPPTEVRRHILGSLTVGPSWQKSEWLPNICTTYGRGGHKYTQKLRDRVIVRAARVTPI